MDETCKVSIVNNYQAIREKKSKGRINGAGDENSFYLINNRYIVVVVVRTGLVYQKQLSLFGKLQLEKQRFSSESPLERKKPL